MKIIKLFEEKYAQNQFWYRGDDLPEDEGLYFGAEIEDKEAIAVYEMKYVDGKQTWFINDNKVDKLFAWGFIPGFNNLDY